MKKVLIVIDMQKGKSKQANTELSSAIIHKFYLSRSIGSAVEKHKDAQLVKTAFYGVQADNRRIEIFHADRGSEFKKTNY